MALEDASVLAELVLSRAEIDDELFALFMDRRYERAKTIIEQTRVQLCTWLLEHNRGGRPPRHVRTQRHDADRPRLIL